MTPRRHPCSHSRLATAIACAAVLLSACWYSSNSAGNVQARYARKLAPARVGQAPNKTFDEIRTLKVRVYADASYRSSVLHWKVKFRRLMRRVNKVVTPLFGVKLEVVDIQAWERTGNSNSMAAMLHELEIVDPADDVDFVVGLVTQLDSASSELSMLGMARPLSNHLVMRGMNDVAERKLFDEIFDELDDADREKLYQARKAHKELTLFLHEWAHTLGAPHTRGNAEAIMNVSYSNAVRKYGAPSIGIIEIGLRYRGIGAGPPLEQGDMLEEMRSFIESADRSYWVQEELDQLLSMLQMPQQAGPSERASANLTPSARRSFYRALDHERAGRYEEAWKIVFPMTEMYGEEPSVQVLGCRLATRVKQLAWPAPELCRAATRLAPKDPTPPLAMARAHAAAGDDDKALESLRAAHAILDAADETSEDSWMTLAAGYQDRQLLTWMEQALSHVTDNAVATEMQSYSTQTRRRYGLPKPGDDFGVAPADEAAYLGAVKEALGLVYANRFAEAKKLVKQGRKDYPKAPGFWVVDCDLQMRIGKVSVAKKRCAKAIAMWKQSMWAHYLLGAMDARAKQDASAIGHLERAIELDPEMKALWKLLAQVYERAGKTDELERLESLYRAQFGKSL